MNPGIARLAAIALRRGMQKFLQMFSLPFADCIHQGFIVFGVLQFHCLHYCPTCSEGKRREEEVTPWTERNVMHDNYYIIAKKNFNWSCKKFNFELWRHCQSSVQHKKGVLALKDSILSQRRTPLWDRLEWGLLALSSAVLQKAFPSVESLALASYLWSWRWELGLQIKTRWDARSSNASERRQAPNHPPLQSRQRPASPLVYCLICSDNPTPLNLLHSSWHHQQTPATRQRW